MCSFAENLQHLDQTNSVYSCVAKSDKPGKTVSHGFLQKLFHRQPSLLKLVSTGSEDQLILSRLGGDDDKAQMDIEVLPCPYIRPLGNRLEPRIENAHLALGQSFIGSKRSMLRRNDESSHIPLSAAALDQTGIKSYDISSALNTTSRQFLMSREEIALTATANDTYLIDWKYYLKCYSEGRYNLTVPPSPPPKNSKFIYLPSIYPPNEMERLAAFRSSPMWSGTDVVWTGLEIECARSLIMAATAKFKLPSAAISFFDRDFEIVQAERGYSRHLIPRHESIASHVLLTDEVMTILDAQKDWRFLGNPLVVGSPEIRFFAGTPLLSPNGQIVGVFAVFGSEPRSSFSAKQRRYLNSLGEVAARELITSRYVSYNMSRHDSLCSGQVSYNDKIIHHTSSLSPPSSIEIERTEYISAALRYHKKSRNAIGRSRVFINSEAEYAHAQNKEGTPPSSDSSDTGTSPMTVQSSSIDEGLSLSILQNESLNCGNTPDSPTCGAFSPEFNVMCDSIIPIIEARPFSDTFLSNDALVLPASDPESSTEILSNVSSFSIDSEEIQTLLEEAPLVDVDERNELVVVNDPEVYSASATNDRESPMVNSRPEAINGHINRHMKIAFTFDSISPRIFESIDVQAEARFAAELWANNLAFDALYAVELIERRKLTRQLERQLHGNIETRILVAYGLPDPINFDIPIHLNVLNGYGAITWENKNAMPEEYSLGFMMPLPFESGVLDSRSFGVVFGAFRRKPNSVERLPKLKVAEVERLQRAAIVLKEILCRAPWLRQSSQDKMEQLPK